MAKLTPQGQEINRLQKRAGITDTELAYLLGVREGTLWRWKHGIHRIKKVYLEKIQESCRRRTGTRRRSFRIKHFRNENTRRK